MIHNHRNIPVVDYIARAEAEELAQMQRAARGTIRWLLCFAALAAGVLVAKLWGWV